MNVKPCSNVLDGEFDVVVFVNDGIKSLGSNFAAIEKAFTAYEKVKHATPSSIYLPLCFQSFTL